MKVGLALILIIVISSTVGAAEYIRQSYTLTFDYTGNVSSIITFETQKNGGQYTPINSANLPLDSQYTDIARCMLTTNLGNRRLTFSFQWAPLKHEFANTTIPYGMVFGVNSDFSIPENAFPALNSTQNHSLQIILEPGNQTKTIEVCTFRIFPDQQSAARATAGNYQGTIIVNITEGAS